MPWRWQKKVIITFLVLSSTFDTENFIEDAKFVIDLCCEYEIKEFDLDFDINALENCDIEIVAE